MPFLVDSVTNAIGATGRAIHLVVHPQLVVRRDEAGRLVEILDIDVDDERPAGTIAESWMWIEMERDYDDDAAASLDRQIAGVLHDVRVAVRDWRAMRSRALILAEEIVGHAAGGRAPGGGRRGSRPAALARRRQPHLPRLPRVRAEGRRRRGLPHPGRRQRPGHPQHGRRPRGADRDVEELRLAAARRPGARPRARAPGAEQGELAIHRAPQRVPGLHRREDVRRGGRGDGRAALPRALLLQRLHAEHPRHPDPADEGTAPGVRARLRRRLARRQGPADVPRDVPARRALPDARRPAREDRPVGAAPAGAPAHQALPAPRRLRPVHVLPGLPAA